MGQVWKWESEEKSFESERSQKNEKKIRRGVLVRFSNHRVTSQMAGEPSTEPHQEGCPGMASGSLNKSENATSPGIEMVVIVHSGH